MGRGLIHAPSAAEIAHYGGRGLGSSIVAAAPPPAEIAFAQPDGLGSNYNIAFASVPGAFVPGTIYGVHKQVSTPAANGFLCSQATSVTGAGGFRVFITPSGGITARITYGGVRRDSSIYVLANGAWYIWHAVGDGTDLRLYVDGVLVGTPVAATGAYAAAAVPFAIGSRPATATGGIGVNARIGGIGLAATALSAAQVTAHTAAIKAALACVPPGLSANEWNWTAGDAAASWTDDESGLVLTREDAFGETWSYGTESSPTWGS